MKMDHLSKRLLGAAMLFAATAVMAAPAPAAAADKPNIVVIMGDDIGMWNIGA